MVLSISTNEGSALPRFHSSSFHSLSFHSFLVLLQRCRSFGMGFIVQRRKRWQLLNVVDRRRILSLCDRRIISATGDEVINDFRGPIYLFVDCPLSPIHDGVVHIVRLSVCINAANFDAMLHAGPASILCCRKKPFFQLIAPRRRLRTMVLSMSTNEGLATKRAILNRGRHDGSRTQKGGVL